MSTTIKIPIPADPSWIEREIEAHEEIAAEIDPTHGYMPIAPEYGEEATSS